MAKSLWQEIEQESKKAKKAVHKPRQTKPRARGKRGDASVSMRTKGTVGKPSERPSVRTTVRKIKRVKVRYAFEFFQDQIAKLKELRRSALIKDEDFSMSDFVRKALDDYFKKARR